MARWTLPRADRAIPVLGFVGVGARIARVLSICEPVIDPAGQRVGRGHDRCRGAMCGPQAVVKAAQGAGAGVYALGGQPEGRRGPVGGFFRARAPGLPARDVLGGGQAKPGGQVLSRGPPRPLPADVGDDRVDGEPLPAIDLGQIHTGHLIAVAAHIEGGCSPLGCVASALAWRYGVVRAVDLGCEGRVLLRDLLVTGGDRWVVKSVPG